MHRSINLSTDDSNTLLPNIENTNINRLNEIVNFSVDTINCQVLEYVMSQHLDQVLGSLFTKIRTNGILTLRFKNFKEISKKYFSDQMSDQEYLQHIANVHSIISIDKIASSIDNTLVISNIEYDNFHVLVVVQRVGT